MKADTKEKRGPVPPYIPFKTFLTFLDRISVGVPSHIDRSVMPSMSGAAQSGLMNALSYLNLMNEQCEPSELLGGLAQSTGEERQRLLTQLWRATYDKLNLDFESTTQKQLDDALSAQGVSGATVSKCRSFLLSFAHTAGLKLSPYLKGAGSSSGTNRRKKPQAKRARTTRETSNKIQQPLVMKSPEQVLIEILDTDAMDENEQEAVWTLIKYLKNQSMDIGSDE